MSGVARTSQAQGQAQRQARRSVAAQVVDLADMSCFEAKAFDLTANGCKITTERTDLLKQDIGLRIAGVDKLLRGTVVAFNEREARISFRAQAGQAREKRREVRRPVRISAIVCSKSDAATMKCSIVDASRSGCRLEGDAVARLPDAIEISIPGLDLPISGAVVWRRDNQAGIQLTWPMMPEPGRKVETLVKMLNEEKKASAAKPRKKRVSAFGA